MKCPSCKDWQENIDMVDAPRMLAHARNPGTADYKGKKFVYCPWCATLLVPNETEL